MDNTHYHPAGHPLNPCHWSKREMSLWPDKFRLINSTEKNKPFVRRDFSLSPETGVLNKMKPPRCHMAQTRPSGPATTPEAGWAPHTERPPLHFSIHLASRSLGSVCGSGLHTCPQRCYQFTAPECAPWSSPGLPCTRLPTPGTLPPDVP